MATGKYFICFKKSFCKHSNHWLSIEKLYEKCLEAYSSCRLTHLNNEAGVRPIGMGEFLCLIRSKCTIKRIENKLHLLGANKHLCLGYKCGIEHVIHSRRSQYEKLENEAVLLLDAKNAFNCLNCNMAVENVKRIYTALSFVVRLGRFYMWHVKPCNL